MPPLALCLCYPARCQPSPFLLRSSTSLLESVAGNTPQGAGCTTTPGEQPVPAGIVQAGLPLSFAILVVVGRGGRFPG